MFIFYCICFHKYAHNEHLYGYVKAPWLHVERLNIEKVSSDPSGYSFVRQQACTKSRGGAATEKREKVGLGVTSPHSSSFYSSSPYSSEVLALRTQKTV